MSVVAYFIGGPLDLTKTVLRDAESRMFALEKAALTLGQINTAQDYKNARNLIDERHVYHARPIGRIAHSGSDHVVYLYHGMERNRA